MSIAAEDDDFSKLAGSLRDASAITSALIESIIRTVCRRFPSAGQPGKTARMAHLITSQAWTDAVLALIAFELPQWQTRRIVYDEGEWHCALSRERELPEWLDQSIEAHHPDLALAMLCAFVDARLASSSRTSVPPCVVTQGHPTSRSAATISPDAVSIGAV
jgi:hypothetical protein